jgi:hypothetical protein
MAELLTWTKIATTGTHNPTDRPGYEAPGGFVILPSGTKRFVLRQSGVAVIDMGTTLAACKAKAEEIALAEELGKAEEVAAPPLAMAVDDPYFEDTEGVDIVLEPINPPPPSAEFMQAAGDAFPSTAFATPEQVAAMNAKPTANNNGHSKARRWFQPNRPARPVVRKTPPTPVAWDPDIDDIDTHDPFCQAGTIRIANR